jgi:hypothetical protein
MLGLVLAQAGAPPAAGSEALERMKLLAGTWTGTSQRGADETEPVTAQYRLTAGGNAVVETLCPGTPDETVSVYYDRDDRLTVTHYGAEGNRPVLAVRHTDASTIHLGLVTDDAAAAHAPQMHELTLAWTDPDNLTHTWTIYEDGLPTDATTVTLSRSR